jgi:hypothetical protein
MGNVLDLARKDAQYIITQGGFETQITIKVGLNTDIVTGLGLVHHIALDTEGNPVNSKQAHISVFESSFVTIAPRNLLGEVFLRGAIVTFMDASKITKSYSVKENFADDTLGVIVLNLGKYVDPNI